MGLELCIRWVSELNKVEGLQLWRGGDAGCVRDHKRETESGGRRSRSGSLEWVKLVGTAAAFRETALGARRTFFTPWSPH